MTHDNTALAWAAGIIDGDGCISMDWRGYPRLSIRMAHKPTIVKLHRIFKLGSVSRWEPKHTNWRVCWTWNVGTQQAVSVISSVYPFLVTKKVEASIIMKLGSRQKGRNHVGVTVKEKQIRAKLKLRLKDVMKREYR